MAKNYNVQGLRAYAAYAVVGHHIVDSLRNYIAVGRFHWNPAFGSYGVEIFFVISGYVMMLTTSERQQTPHSFLLHRIARVGIMYWILTFISAVLVISGLNLFGNGKFSAVRLLTSLLFLPYMQDGKILNPILFVGWTLNYEMMFYVAFAGVMLIAARALRVLLLAGIIFCMIALQAIFEFFPLNYLGNDIVLGFALGLLLWLFTSRFRLKASLSFSALLIGAVALALIDASQWGGIRHAVILISIFAAGIVTGAICLEHAGYSIGKGWLSRQGDASYSLYLIHPFTIQAIGKMSLMTGLNRTHLGLILIAVLMFLISGLAGTVLHLYLEKPLLRWAGRVLG